MQTADFNAVAGGRYGIDTVGGIITATLPASPSDGDAIFFSDVRGGLTGNKLVIARNTGQLIMGLGEDMDVTGPDGTSFGVVYRASGADWRVY